MQALAQDVKLQTTKLFADVWGAGPATAERWWAEGCRSLADVEKRDDLSQRQVWGHTCSSCPNY